LLDVAENVGGKDGSAGSNLWARKGQAAHTDRDDYNGLIDSDQNESQF